MSICIVASLCFSIASYVKADESVAYSKEFIKMQRDLNNKMDVEANRDGDLPTGSVIDAMMCGVVSVFRGR